MPQALRATSPPLRARCWVRDQERSIVPGFPDRLPLGTRWEQLIFGQFLGIFFPSYKKVLISVCCACSPKNCSSAFKKNMETITIELGYV